MPKRTRDIRNGVAYIHVVRLFPLPSQTLYNSQETRKTKLFVLNALKPIWFQIIFFYECNVLQHHRFLSGAFVSLQQQLSFNEFLSVWFSPLFLTCAVLAFLSSLLCTSLLYWKQISSSFRHHPLSLPFSVPLVIPLPLSNSYLCWFCYQFKHNYNKTLPPPQFSTQPLFHSRHSGTLVLPVAYT